MLTFARRALLTAVFLVGSATSAFAQVELSATSYIIGNPASGRVLLEKNADMQVEPASLAKMMTLYLLFERLKSGEISLEQEMSISERAWRKGGSKMFLEVGKTAAVKDLILGITVASGNDACIVVAENVAGSEEGFVDMMNDKAKKLGMTGTKFTNASGWPDPDQRTTARDMYTLSSRLMADFPEYYSNFSQTSFTYNGIRQFNRNRLLERNLGVDGMKTGHVESAGFHLAAAALRKDIRLISVVIGANSMSAREEETLKGLSWVYSQYNIRTVLRQGEEVASGKVFLGQQATVPLVAGENLELLLGNSERQQVKAEAVFSEPLEAPIAKGQEIGKIVVTAPGYENEITVPLLAGADVAEKSFGGRVAERLRTALGL